ncbi:MAG: LemA family protein [Oscillospiraceae bacterium]|nr:LemA family protein [Oscillospiraceae bacterium]
MKKKGCLIGIVAVVAVIIIIVATLAGGYNNLVKLEESTNTAFADIQVQLQRRSDLIPNLVNTVQGYASHETEVFTAVSDARAKLAGATTVEETSEADGELSSALGRLLAISESYPELKANENFLSLQDELAGTENRIGVARKDYNEKVQEYNVKIRTFPTAIFAGMLGFEKKALFEAAAGAENAPIVNFN